MKVYDETEQFRHKLALSLGRLMLQQIETQQALEAKSAEVEALKDQVSEMSQRLEAEGAGD